MNRDQIVAALDEEIASLIAARDLLLASAPPATRGRGRPKGSISKETGSSPENSAPKKRHAMSAEGKARIAEAQRRRWAAKNAASAKKVPAKQSSSAKKAAAVKKPTPAATKKAVAASKVPAKKGRSTAAPNSGVE